MNNKLVAMLKNNKWIIYICIFIFVIFSIYDLTKDARYERKVINYLEDTGYQCNKDETSCSFNQGNIERKISYHRDDLYWISLRVKNNLIYDIDRDEVRIYEKETVEENKLCTLNREDNKLKVVKSQEDTNCSLYLDEASKYYEEFTNIYVETKLNRKYEIEPFKYISTSEDLTTNPSIDDKENKDDNKNDNENDNKNICIRYTGTKNVFKIGDKFSCRLNQWETYYKFYVLSEDDDNVYLLTEKNVVDKIQWLSLEDYQKSEFYRDDYRVYNDGGPITVTKKLEEIKKRWTDVDDVMLPTADMIADAVGNTSWSSKTATSWGLFYFDTLTDEHPNLKSGQSKYAWLFNYLRKCYSEGCSILGEDYANGYWTSSPVKGDRYEDTAWIVHSGGLFASDVDSKDIGLRPVIIVNKSKIS